MRTGDNELTQFKEATYRKESHSKIGNNRRRNGLNDVR